MTKRLLLGAQEALEVRRSSRVIRFRVALQDTAAPGDYGRALWGEVANRNGLISCGRSC